MPVDLNRLTEGWLELESDPGLFTLLLEDFGVRGVQVEEIYDLQKPIESPVYGFIFLFKWIEERRSRRKVIVTDESFIQDEETVNSIFFAHQIVPNSCATHALLSVLLNCNKIHLGETLTRLMEYTRNMSPENKGYAIGNTPELAKAHNSHAKPEPRRLHEKSHGIPTGRTMEAFHFVSYVPIDGQLFELDGLKPFPINHGPWGEHEDWTEKFRRVMKERLGIATGGELHDIRFNLMAVVPDRRLAYEHKLRTLKTNRQIVLEALQQLVKMTHPELTSDDHAEYIAAMHRSKQQQQSLSSSSSEKNDTSEDQNSTENSNSSTKTTLSTSTNLGNAVLSITSCSTSSVTTSTPAAAASPQSGLKKCRRTSVKAQGQKNFKSSFKMKSVTTRVTSSPAPYIPAHPALDSHNYAKSPLMEGLGEDDNSRPRGSDYTSDEDAETHSHVTENDNTDSNAMDDLPQNLRESPADDSSTLKPIHVDTKDYSHPLSIQTKFETSPTPSNSSTDTSSEVGSAFNSPVRTLNFASAQNSPTFCSPQDIRKFVVIRVSGSKDNYDDSSGIMTSEQSRDGLDSPQENAPFSSSSSTASSGSPDKSSIRKAEGELAGCSGGDFYSDNLKRTSSEEDSFTVDPVPKKTCPSTLREASEKETTEKQIDKCAVNVDSGNTSKVSSGKNESKFPEAKREHSKYPQLIEPHTFAPKDLLALLKNVENEITVCESNLRDEIEKRKKYKIDDCRRTHNYDRFICTFLSMLAQQKKLADLVKQHVLIKKRQGINVGRLHKKADRRRRSRPKKRK